jgi:hypothetical protein
MAIFNSYVSLPDGKSDEFLEKHEENHKKTWWQTHMMSSFEVVILIIPCDPQL